MGLGVAGPGAYYITCLQTLADEGLYSGCLGRRATRTLTIATFGVVFFELVLIIANLSDYVWAAFHRVYTGVRTGVTGDAVMILLSQGPACSLTAQVCHRAGQNNSPEPCNSSACGKRASGQSRGTQTLNKTGGRLEMKEPVHIGIASLL